ncbi:MAG: hypothetical protein ABI164_05995 [Acidobacteriaceae bacterium]
MTDTSQSGASPSPHSGRVNCAAVEQWLAESAENALTPTIAEQLCTHAAGCAACQEKLAQAHSGREWLLVLKQEPLDPPADLVAKILARTSLASAGSDGNPEFPRQKSAAKGSIFGKRRIVPPGIHPGPGPTESIAIPAWQNSSVVVLRRTLLDPRLALVAAMAFFSISLTLNMLGFRLTSLHAADLAPRNIHRTVIRQVAQTNARVVRYYENLRIVYEVEARVQQLRRAAETSTPPPQQDVRPRNQSSGSAGDSSGNSINRPVDPKPIRISPRMEAALNAAGGNTSKSDGWVQIEIGLTLSTSFVQPLPLRSALLAPPCMLHSICSMRYLSVRERRLA